VEIRGAAERAAALIRQLLSFSRRHPPVLVRLDLNALLAGLTPALRRLLRPGIEVSSTLRPGVGEVQADPAHLGEAVLALAENARDAMPQGGQLIIETSIVNLGPEQERWGGPGPGPAVLLTVSDTGHGMDEATRARLFEPFFTTKEVGQGTGLGLAAAYGTVREAGGQIEVDSEPGKGTTFRIYLPRVGEVAGEGQAKPPAAEGAEGA
jgi:signal transduction histidine kinase